MSEYLDFEDVMNTLQIDAEELKGLIKSGTLPAYKDGNQVKFYSADVEVMRQGMETEPTIMLPSDIADSDDYILADSDDDLDFEDDLDITVADSGDLAIEDVPTIDLSDDAAHATENILFESDEELTLTEDDTIVSEGMTQDMTVDVTVDEEYDSGGRTEVLQFTDEMDAVEGDDDGIVFDDEDDDDEEYEDDDEYDDDDYDDDYEDGESDSEGGGRKRRRRHERSGATEMVGQVTWGVLTTLVFLMIAMLIGLFTMLNVVDVFETNEKISFREKPNIEPKDQWPRVNLKYDEFTRPTTFVLDDIGAKAEEKMFKFDYNYYEGHIEPISDEKRIADLINSKIEERVARGSRTPPESTEEGEGDDDEGEGDNEGSSGDDDEEEVDETEAEME